VDFLCSWSGGKDSCLALHRALRAGGRCAGLFTMLDEAGARSRSHGLRPEVLQAQADALGLPLHTARASWQGYEAAFVEGLRAATAAASTVVFGDIDLEPHRAWEEKVAAAAGLRAELPLWQWPRRALLEEFLDAGFEALIVAARESRLDRSCLGRRLDPALIAWIESQGADACGEEGEFHTLVVDGPLFRHRLEVAQEEASLHGGVWCLDLAPAEKSRSEG
jgi:uncharacterized protein (TIGR00290 family)